MLKTQLYRLCFSGTKKEQTENPVRLDRTFCLHEAHAGKWDLSLFFAFVFWDSCRTKILSS